MAFGDDGTGDPFCVRIDGSPVEDILRWPYIGAQVDGEWQSLEHFAAEWLEREI